MLLLLLLCVWVGMWVLVCGNVLSCNCLLGRPCLECHRRSESLLKAIQAPGSESRLL